MIDPIYCFCLRHCSPSCGASKASQIIKCVMLNFGEISERPDLLRQKIIPVQSALGVNLVLSSSDVHCK